MTTTKAPSVIVYDPISFHGGSKVATLTALNQLPLELPLHILTATANSWTLTQDQPQRRRTIRISKLLISRSLAQQTTGTGYWLKQLYLAIVLCVFCLLTKLNNSNRPLKLVLASGPGVDMAGYWVAKLFKLDALQLIHGPVGKSRLSCWAIKQGHPTYYLPCAKPSLLRLLDTNKSLPSWCQPFINGLDTAQWPSQQSHDFSFPLRLLWAASLLKWKGLHILQDALQLKGLDSEFRTHVCYIRPEKSSAEQSTLPSSLANCHCLENPPHLDTIRAQCHLFVSTSHNEPFGLSILEALAAGLVVVIPKDGAYWDEQLEHSVNCFKYQPGCADSLNLLLGQLLVNRRMLPSVAKQGQIHAQQYRASHCYREIANTLLSTQPRASTIANKADTRTTRG